MEKPIVLTIAGSDSGGGAGVQADIKTMTVNGVYATSAITALTAQNTLGITEIYEISPEFLKAELAAVFADLYPDAVKIGMVSSTELIKVIAQALKKYKAKNIVLDPVMISTSGSRLLTEEAIKILMKELFPLSSLITPNIPETEIILSEMNCKNKIISMKDIEQAAKKIAKVYNCSVLIKGGHSINDANDYLFDVISNKGECYSTKRIDNPNTHGTGCTLSSAIASFLAKGKSTVDSVCLAKQYLTGALKADLDLGKGSGPLDHAYKI